jgi:hypothetical protein
MRRIIITALFALTALGGVASADRGHHNNNRNNWSHNNNTWRNANGGVRVERRQQRPVVRYQSRRYDSGRRWDNSRRYVRPSVRFVRRPIFVQRPVIRYHYYNYYQRPAVIVENYPTRAGYYWVAGQWTWNGYEWMWQPGHYEPDPNYIDPSYSNGYYDQYGNWIDTSY